MTGAEKVVKWYDDYLKMNRARPAGEEVRAQLYMAIEEEKQVNSALVIVSNCPSCDGKNLLQYRQHHINCTDCKELFTMDCD